MERTFIITGGNSGLGYQCAKNIALENRNNHIVIASRNMEKSQKSVAEIIHETGNQHLYALSLDLASLASIRNFSEVFRKSNLPMLYGLVCNAIGGYTGKAQYTKDGFEMTFGTGHLGHFLLSNLLLRNIQDNGRVIFVSSDQHNPPRFIGKIHYTDALKFAYPKESKHVTRYSGTKLCNIYCAYEMAERIKNETTKSITVNAFNPAFMANTELGRNTKTVSEKIMKWLAPQLARLMGLHSSAEKSGRLLASMMTDSRFERVTGKYFDREKEALSSELSHNKANAANLWEQSTALTLLQQNETIFKI
jgi:NAD(P)-dependent dehydrogenase (short-subunit alcohol dehydrogenase family)